MLSLRTPSRTSKNNVPSCHFERSEKSHQVVWWVLSSRHSAGLEMTLRWRTVKLTIAFDGTRYEGWQSQRTGKTLQEVFEKILAQLFKVPTPIIGSSRTDSGVHAEGFVAHFKTKSRLTDQAIQKALNFYLPKDIVVLSAGTVRPDFHARFDAKSKIYRYTILTRKTRPIFEAPYVLWHPYPLNVMLMKQAAGTLKGRHDFRAFSNKDVEKSTVRTIKKISVARRKDRITVTLEADGFLKQMVRVIIGTLLEVGSGKMAPQKITQILKSKDRNQAGPTARPHGLTLVKVTYASTSSSRKRGSE